MKLELAIIDDKDRELSKEIVKVGYVLRVEDKAKVKRGQIIASWDPYTTPVIAEKKGKVRFKDIVIGKTVKEDYDPTIKVTKRVVIEHREELEPQIVLEDNSGKIVSDHSLSLAANIIVEEGQNVAPGDILAKYPRVIGRVQDITGGLPRVSELFEARNPKNPAVLSEIDGRVDILPGEKGGGRIVKVAGETFEKKGKGRINDKTYNIPYGKHLLVSRGDYVVAGSKLTDGPAVLADILRIQGEKKVQEYFLGEIEKVYRIEGVSLNDKHIEVIIKQMLSKVRVVDPGDTFLLEGEEIDRVKIQRINETLEKGKKPATFEPLVLGITRVSLSSDSFISAASFQETLKVLTNAAITGAEDELAGLKENVILGKLVPAGTGIFENVQTETGQVKETMAAEVQPA